jgi:hypothetical protein
LRVDKRYSASVPQVWEEDGEIVGRKGEEEKKRCTAT